MAVTQTIIEQHIKRRDQARNRRNTFEQHWEDLSRVMLPRRQGFTTRQIDGDSRVEDIFDGTPMQGARSLANTVGAMIRPEGQRLTNIRAEKDSLNSDDEAMKWLEGASEKLDSAIRNPKARFRQSTGEVDLDLTVLGTGILFIGLSASQLHLLFQSVYLRDALPFFDEEGNPQGLYRTKRIPLWQVAEKFQVKKLSSDTQEKLRTKGNLDEKIEFLYIVFKRPGVIIENPILSRNMPYEELWIEVQKKHVVQEGGFHEFPFIIPRWDTTSGEEYGRSPGMIALPDSNTLQAMGETILVAGQKNADPPLMAPNDGTFSEVNTFPGGISYYDVETATALRGKNPFFPLVSGANLPITRDMQADSRNQVFMAFFKNILNLPVGGPQMTATEIIQRKDEFIREVGPVFGRFETDYNQPLAERAFNIMIRAGVFSEIPKILQGETVKFEFELPVTKIRKQVEAAAAEEWARGVYEIAAVDPSAADLVNTDELARFRADAAGVPIKVLRGRREVDEIRTARQEAEAKQAQLIEEDTKAGTLEKIAGAANKGGLVDQETKQPAKK